MKYAVVLVEDLEGKIRVEYAGKDRSEARGIAKLIAQNPPKDAAKVVAFGDVPSIYAKRLAAPVEAKDEPVEAKDEPVKPKGAKG